MSTASYETDFDKQLFDEFYNVQPQVILWMKPVWDASGTKIVDFTYNYCNKEGFRYMHITPDQLSGLKLSTSPTVPDDLRSTIMREMVQVFLTGEVSQSNVYNQEIDKYARITRSRLRDGVLTIVEDRTEEYGIIHQLEAQTKALASKSREVEDQKNLLDSILVHSSNGISVSRVYRNGEGKVVDALTILANEAAIKFIGLPKEIYLSKKATEIEPDILSTPYYQMCIHTLETGEPFITQYQMQSTGKWLEITVSRLDQDHLIHVFTDVTEVKKSQLELEQTIHDLKRSNESLEQFTSAASHDLKEPIRKVQFYTDMLKERLADRLAEEEKQLLDRVEVAAQRMKLLVDDLLEYSHLNRPESVMEEVDLNRKVRIIMDDLELLVTEKQALVHYSDLPVVKGFRRQLQQVFQNLISNALKYSKAHVPPVITIRAQQVTGASSGMPVQPKDEDTAFHLITVEDNGIGFEEVYADRIFNIFTRLHGNQYAGSGVGLAIVKRVVENHGGYIIAHGRPGEGATFKILLPALLT